MRNARTGRYHVAVALAMLTLAITSPVLAVEPGEVLADPKLEARARDLSTELRCLVCQNQSIDDSNAPLAKDLRVLVRERLVAGDSDADVRRFLVARYGEFVLLRPPFAWNTLVLWLTPVLVLVAALGIIGVRRRSGVAAPVDALSADDKRRVAALMAQRSRDSSA